MSLPLYTSYSEETQTQIEEFLENTFGWDEDELVGFIEIYGEEKFKLYFEEYADMVDDIGCLLYTSPSPRDKRQSRMPSSA